MGVWIDGLGGVLRDASLAAALFLSAAVLAMLGCRQPVRRLWLARASLLGSLLVIPLVGLAPLPRVEVVAMLGRSVLAAHPALTALSGPSHEAGPGAPRGSGPIIGLGKLVGRPSRVVVVAYVAAVGTGLAWLVLGHGGLVWVRRRSSVPSQATRELYATLCDPGRAPALRVSSRVGRPVLVGLVRRAILIPERLDRPGEAESLRLSLLHELAHAERNDSRFALVSSLAQVVWFFLPPLWWIRSQMRLDQEFLADRRAAGAFGPLQSYASSLVNLADPGGPPRPSAARAAPRAVGGGSFLFQRVLMLVHCPFVVEARPPRWWSWTLPGLVLASVLGASTLTLRTPSAASPSPTKGNPAVLGQQGRVFRMSRLVVRPRPAACRAALRLFELPVELPQRFELTVDVWGDPESLAQTRVAGRLLTGPHAPPPSPLPERWHPVRLRRDPHGFTVWVDQRVVDQTQDARTTRYLSVEVPPAQPAHFRNLLLVW